MSGGRRVLALTTFGVLVALGSPGIALAANDIVPVGMQVSLFLKVLPYDRAFVAGSADGVTVGVVFAAADRSQVQKADFVAAFSSAAPRTLSRDRIRLVEIPENRLEASAPGCAAVFLVDGVNYEAAAAILTRLRVPAFAASDSAPEAGVPVAFVPESGRPRILVNLAAATASGMQLDTRLLDLAVIVEPAPPK